MRELDVEGQKLTLSQEAYIDDDMYTAHATNRYGEEFMIHWEIISDSDDEAHACDWENPIYVTPL